MHLPQSFIRQHASTHLHSFEKVRLRSSFCQTRKLVFRRTQLYTTKPQPRYSSDLANRVIFGYSPTTQGISLRDQIQLKFWDPTKRWGIPQTTSRRIILRGISEVWGEVGVVHFTRGTFFLIGIMLIFFLNKNSDF